MTLFPRKVATVVAAVIKRISTISDTPTYVHKYEVRRAAAVCLLPTLFGHPADSVPSFSLPPSLPLSLCLPFSPILPCTHAHTFYTRFLDNVHTFYTRCLIELGPLGSEDVASHAVTQRLDRCICCWIGAHAAGLVHTLAASALFWRWDLAYGPVDSWPRFNHRRQMWHVMSDSVIDVSCSMLCQIG